MQILINEIVSSHELLRIGFFKDCSVYAIATAGETGVSKTHYVRDKLILYVAKTLNTFLTYNHSAAE